MYSKIKLASSNVSEMGSMLGFLIQLSLNLDNLYVKCAQKLLLKQSICEKNTVQVSAGSIRSSNVMIMVTAVFVSLNA